MPRQSTGRIPRESPDPKLNGKTTLEAEIERVRRKHMDPRNRRTALIWLWLCVFAELLLLALQASLISETLTAANVEVGQPLTDIALLRPIFSLVPDVTSLDLLAFALAGFFIGLPILIAHAALSPSGLFHGTALQKWVGRGLIGMYLAVAWVEVNMLTLRIQLGEASPFGPQVAAEESSLALYLGLLYLAMAAVLGAVSASLHLKINPED